MTVNAVGLTSAGERPSSLLFEGQSVKGLGSLLDERASKRGAAARSVARALPLPAREPSNGPEHEPANEPEDEPEHGPTHEPTDEPTDGRPHPATGQKAFGRRPNPSKREVHTAARNPRERKVSGGAPSKGGARTALAQCPSSAPAKGLPEPLKKGRARAALPQKGSARAALPQKRGVTVALIRKGSARAALSRRGHPKPSKREASWRRPLERGENRRRSHLRRWRSRGAATDRPHAASVKLTSAVARVATTLKPPPSPPATPCDGPAGIAHASRPGRPPRIKATPAPSPG